jgi:hypothetical protein
MGLWLPAGTTSLLGGVNGGGTLEIAAGATLYVGGAVGSGCRWPPRCAER